MSRALFNSLERDSLLPLNDLAGAEETGPGRILLKAAEFILDQERRALEEKPRLGCDDVTQDVVFRLGVIKGMRQILALPENARKHLDQLNKSFEEMKR